MLPPAMVFPVPFGTDTDLVLHVGACAVRGWSIQETSETDPALVIIYDGDPSAGLAIATISLNASESTRDYPAGNGIMARTSLYYAAELGETRGSVWLTPLSHAGDMEWAFGERGPYFVRPGS